MARSAAEMRPPAEDSDTPPRVPRTRRLGCGKIAPSTFSHPSAGRPEAAPEEESSMGQMITLKAEDGHSFGAYRAAPAGKPKAGIVVIQEIFGVNSHIKKVTDGFA